MNVRVDPSGLIALPGANGTIGNNRDGAPSRRMRRERRSPLGEFS